MGLTEKMGLTRKNVLRIQNFPYKRGRMLSGLGKVLEGGLFSMSRESGYGPES